jgi:hypothetical protein
VKSKYIINSINNILNEDKFSKYTLRQIYDELGSEGFLDYIEEIVLKIIKGGFVKCLEGAVPYSVMRIDSKQYTETGIKKYAKGFNETVNFSFNREDGRLYCEWRITDNSNVTLSRVMFITKEDETNIFKSLKVDMINYSKIDRMEEKRKFLASKVK